MNSVIDEARAALNRAFEVYWIEGGLPSLLTFKGFTTPVIAYNTRYVEVLYHARKLLDQSQAHWRQDMAERLCLRIMAEFALLQGNAGWGVRALLQSIIDQDPHAVGRFGLDLPHLEAQPISEAYMAIWSFGLAHEIGQLASAGEAAAPIPDSLVLEALESSLADFPNYPADVKNRALADAKAGDAEYALSIPRLRRDSQVNVFAQSISLNATLANMREARTDFDMRQFALEAHIVLGLVALIERCKGIAFLADTPALADNHTRLELVLHPISCSVRARITHLYLAPALAKIAYRTTRPDAEQIAGCAVLLAKTRECVARAFDDIEKGMAKAIRFALSPDQRPKDLMRRFVGRPVPCAIEFREADKFISLATSFGIRHESVGALQRLVEARRIASAKQ